MAPEDWIKFKIATDRHVCHKSLIKDEFLDSLPVWSIEEGEKSSYKGQGHKKCFYKAQTDQQQKWRLLTLKRLTDKKDQLEEKTQKIVCFVETLYFRKTSETQWKTIAT